MCSKHESPATSRGNFLRSIVGAAASVTIATSIPATALARTHAERFLWLRNTRTGEVVRAPFTLDGNTVYNPGYYEICRILRDTHVPLAEGDVLFDVRTIEVLYEVQQVLAMAGINSPIDVYSGYRTQQTNASIEGAKYSFHMKAQAVDFGVEGLSMEYLWKVCNSRPLSGGIGFYSDHIHVDCGPRRYWNG